ncbi:hypothetical protein [Bifidobacterium scaligerum]|uniref:hypothetical protein n=1 Tax=Bifidobacterium scaligerum TaxID=2052656 RepID=UPI0010552727|nr:hypothetical protein [Bifidobacterium scaligerum]
MAVVDHMRRRLIRHRQARGVRLMSSVEALGRYYSYLRQLNQTQALLLAGYQPRGEHTGDGVPRDLSGRPFEPLSSWRGVSLWDI